MKFLALITPIMLLAACNNQNSEDKSLQVKIDSLESQLASTYRPGFGEFMSGIQVHHAKLWFSGTDQNWKLADFEIHEIQETLADIREFCKDRSETKSIGMIDGPIDSVSAAIAKKDPSSFKSSFILLTNTCNNCHKATAHEFNVVTIPTNLPVVNQDFHPTQ